MTNQTGVPENGRSKTSSSGTRSDVESEFRHIAESTEELANSLSGILISVLRDLAVSGIYGRLTVESGHTVPEPRSIFAADYASGLEQEFYNSSLVRDMNFPLYGTTGDLVGVLARLLVYCRETPELKPLVRAADAKIAALGLQCDFMGDTDFIRHLRNAVLHSNFKVLVDPADWNRSKFVFLDVVPPKRRLTAKIETTNEQLMSVVRIIIQEVYESYLVSIGWEIGMSEQRRVD